jgi:hypothetical protein
MAEMVTSIAAHGCHAVKAWRQMKPACVFDHCVTDFG